MSWLYCGPTPRYGHASVMVDDHLMFVLFGRAGPYFSNNDVHTYDVYRRYWNRFETSGGLPSARSHHSACYYEAERSIVVFGGRHSSIPAGDTWVLSVDDGRWTCVPDSPLAPDARSDHCAAIVNDTMYVFGGRDSSGSVCRPEMHSFHIPTRSWKSVVCKGLFPTFCGHRACVVHGRIVSIQDVVCVCVPPCV